LKKAYRQECPRTLREAKRLRQGAAREEVVKATSKPFVHRKAVTPFRQ